MSHRTIGRRSFTFSLAAAAAFLVVSASTASADGAIMAAGHANLRADGKLRTFSFNVVRHPDGTIHGQGQVFNRAEGFRSHLDIDCALIDGNAVIVRGTDDFGDVRVFGARDNGQGSGSPPDELTFITVVALPPDCDDAIALVQAAFGSVDNVIDFVIGPALPIEGGNIQVFED